MKSHIRSHRALAPLLALIAILSFAGCGGADMNITNAPTTTGCPPASVSDIYGQLSSNIPQSVAFDITSNIQANVNGVSVSYLQANGQGDFNAVAPVFHLKISTGDSKRPSLLETTTPSGTTLVITGQSPVNLGQGRYSSGIGIDLNDPLNYSHFRPDSVTCASMTVGNDVIQVWGLHGPVESALSIAGVSAGGSATEDLYVSTGTTSSGTAPAKYFPVQMTIRAETTPLNQYVRLNYSHWSRKSAAHTTGSNEYEASFTHTTSPLAPSIIRHWTASPTSFGTELTVTTDTSAPTPTPVACVSGCGATPLAMIVHSQANPDDGDPGIDALINAAGPLLDDVDTCGNNTTYLNLWGWYPDIKWISKAC